MRFGSIMFAAAVATAAFAGSASAQSTPAVTHKQVLDMAAANQIVDVQEFWFNPNGGWTGVEGFSPNGEWFELVVDPQGKIVRSGVDKGPKPTVPLGAAADIALKNGIAKLRGVWRRDSNWVVSGWDSAEKEVTIIVDGAKGEVTKLGG